MKYMEVYEVYGEVSSLSSPLSLCLPSSRTLEVCLDFALPPRASLEMLSAGDFRDASWTRSRVSWEFRVAVLARLEGEFWYNVVLR